MLYFPPLTPGGINILGGAEWWNGILPDASRLTRWELAAYATGLTFLIMIFLFSTLLCIYNVIKPPNRD